jgi:RecA-family ATPase
VSDIPNLVIPEDAGEDIDFGEPETPPLTEAEREALAQADLSSHDVATAEAGPRLVGLSHADLLKREVPPVTQLVEDVVEAGTIGAIAALPGRYKSWVALELGFKVACNNGSRFLGEAAIVKGGPVGYWWQDDSEANELTRIHAYAKHHKQTGKLPIRWHLNEGLRLPDDIPRLKAEIEAEKQVLVVLDSLYNFLPGLDLKDEAVAAVLQRLKAEVCDPTGCTVCYVDHAPWPSEGNRNQRRGYGSVFKAAAIRWGIFLEKPGSTLWLEARATTCSASSGRSPSGTRTSSSCG